MTASPFDGIDTSDPCAAWPILNRALLELLAGASESRIRFGSDEVMFQPFTAQHIPELRREVNRLKAACEAKAAGRPIRRAFRAGFR